MEPSLVAPPPNSNPKPQRCRMVPGGKSEAKLHLQRKAPAHGRGLPKVAEQVKPRGRTGQN